LNINWITEEEIVGENALYDINTLGYFCLNQRKNKNKNKNLIETKNI